MKRILSLLVALALVLSMVPSVFAAAGDAQEPIDLTVDLAQEGDYEATVTVPAGTTHYFTSYGIAGMEMTINGGEAVLCAGNPRMPYSWFITNDGAEAAEYVIAVGYPQGSMANPIALEELSWTYTDYSQTAGAEGCFYTYTAPADGTVTFYFAAAPEGYVCDIVVQNNTTYQQKTLLMDGVDNYGMEVTMDVQTGNELMIQVLAVQDAESNYYPAADLTWVGNFAYPKGSEQNPIYLEWIWDDAYITATCSVTVAAGETLYYIGNAAMELTVDGVATAQNADGVFSLTNTSEAEATYALVLDTPVGAYEKPEIIDNIAPFEDTNSLAADESYNYIWTATEDVTLVMDVTDGANITVDVLTYSEDSEWPMSIQFVLAEPEIDQDWNYTGWIVAENLTLDVVAGQQLKIQVAALTDWDTWSTPAVDYTLTISEPMGTEQNPIDLTADLAQEGDFEATVTVPAGTTHYFMSYGIAGMEMTINGGEAVLCTGNPRMPYNWSIANDGDEDAEYVIAVAIPLGSMENPAELEINMNNYAAIAEGSQGYCYTWTATVAGTLELSFYAEDANWNPLGWSYVINNLTSYTYGDMQDSTSDTVVNPAVITVAAGDEIQIIVNTLDPENLWTAPAGDMYVEATFTCTEHGETTLEDNYDGTHSALCTACGATVSGDEHTFVDGVCACGAQVPGTEANPIDLTNDLIYEEDFSATVTVPANTTCYFMSYGLTGMNMSINGGEAVLCTGNPRMPYTWFITNDGTEDAEYVITVAAPMGTMDNPAELVIGENAAVIDTGSLGYFYTWTAAEAGELTITMPEGNWTYVVNNLTTYAYGETQWSDSDPVLPSYTVAVAAGNEIQIIVNTYDPENPWGNPEGTITFTAVFAGATPENGWTVEDEKWCYYENGIKVTNTWKKDSTGWCYLGADGYMVTNGWQKDSYGWCYLGADGYMITNARAKDSHGWCYMGADGYMVYNQWAKDAGGWSYVGADGYCVTNTWKKDSTGWCYLGDDGYMVINNWAKDSAGWCYLGANGYCVTNSWQQDSHGWCYLDANGRMVYNQWVKDSVGWCYVGADGYMVVNGWAKDSTGWCFMGEDGYIVYNDLVLDFDNEKIYYVDESGYMVSNKWIGEGNEWIYFGADGALVVSDWVYYNGEWYFIDEDGFMLYNCTVMIDGVTYTFNASGVLV